MQSIAAEANQNMSKRERLEATFALKEPDRTPILGGWIACAEHMMTITGASAAEYWSDPTGVSILAYEKLGTDGLIDIFRPKNRDDFRSVDIHTYAKADLGISLEDTLARIDALPSPEIIESRFNFDLAYENFRQSLRQTQARCGKMVWMPAQWSAGARLNWYASYGYENFFYVVGLYPDRARKLMEVGGAQGRCQSRLVAKAVVEGLYPKAVLLGEDICSQRGPMVSPDFLERYYAPQLQYGLEPLLAVGCAPIWHCDGDVRLLLDFLIDAGVQGFQGFQPECGMLLEDFVQKRTRDSKPLIIFGPLAVTTELPRCTPEEIFLKVKGAIALCKGRAALVIFTANTINPDVPLENILAMYQAIRP